MSTNVADMYRLLKLAEQDLCAGPDLYALMMKDPVILQLINGYLQDPNRKLIAARKVRRQLAGAVRLLKTSSVDADGHTDLFESGYLLDLDLMKVGLRRDFPYMDQPDTITKEAIRCLSDRVVPQTAATAFYTLVATYTKEGLASIGLVTAALNGDSNVVDVDGSSVRMLSNGGGRYHFIPNGDVADAELYERLGVGNKTTEIETIRKETVLTVEERIKQACRDAKEFVERVSNLPSVWTLPLAYCEKCVEPYSESSEP